MDIVIISSRNIVVDDMGDIINIQTPGCHISGHQYPDLIRFEKTESFLPIGLGFSAMNRFNLKSSF